MRRRFKPRHEKLCAVAGCTNLTFGQHCDQHRGMAGMSANQAESKSFLHTAAWLKLRAVKLAETPWCEYCSEEGRGEFVPAIDVDHIMPRHSYPKLHLQMSNLKSSCKRCHGLKTARGE
jgi:5-methylcytosine-specific restriction enzyme A